MSVTMLATEVVTLRADFNEIEDRVFLWALRDGKEITRGEWVVVEDAEQNSCQGRIEDYNEHLVRVRLDRRSWINGMDTPDTTLLLSDAPFWFTETLGSY